MATLIQGFDTRLANQPFLVLDFLALLKTKNCRLASNPLVTVPILKLWAKMG